MTLSKIEWQPETLKWHAVAIDHTVFTIADAEVLKRVAEIKAQTQSVWLN